MLATIILRTVGAVVLGLAGFALADLINDHNPPMEGPFWIILLSVLFAELGLGLIIPPQGLRLAIKRIPAQTLFGASVGLIVAVVLSAVLAVPFSLLSGGWAKIIPGIVFLVLAYFCITFMIIRSRDIAMLFRVLSPLASKQGKTGISNVILDTNSIIDGRIADVVQTGFIRGTLVVSSFVLGELQYIADSEDPLRRTRGRRGLDILARLREEPGVTVQVSDMDFAGVREVDTKLIKLAEVMRCPIITNDVNLSRVALLQDVEVLNINELANALKPAILPSEEMRLKIIQEGKEPGQGIGYLDDGTVVVVEGGSQYIDSEIVITVNRVLQTGSGKMVFAQPRS